MCRKTGLPDHELVRKDGEKKASLEGRKVDRNFEE